MSTKKEKEKGKQSTAGFEWIKAAHDACPFYANRSIAIPSTAEQDGEPQTFTIGEKTYQVKETVRGIVIQRVLLELALRADAKGMSFPSGDYLRHYCGIASKQTLSRALQILKADGVITVKRSSRNGRAGVNRYWLHRNILRGMAQQHRYFSAGQRSVAERLSAALVVAPTSPKELRERSGDPEIFEVTEWFLDCNDDLTAYMCGLDHIPVILQAAENGNPVCFDSLRDYLQHYPCIRDSYAAHNPNAALVEWDPLADCCELVEYVNQNGLLAELRGRRLTDAEYQHFRSLHKTQSSEHAL